LKRFGLLAAGGKYFACEIAHHDALAAFQPQQSGCQLSSSMLPIAEQRV
jgi:hypothetical protein